MEWECLTGVFEEFVVVSLILILFDVNINIKIEIFKKTFLSISSKKDSRPEGQMSDWFINFQPFKSTIRECSHMT